MAELLRIEKATKTFVTPEGGLVKALDDVSLTINNNEFLALLGPSGCGKTTLLSVIGGFEDLDEGDLYLEGRSLARIPAHRRPFNTVFQSYALFPHMTIAQNVAYGLEVAGVGAEERRRRRDEALELVGLGGYGSRSPNQLSGGQQQRVALARALVLKPKLLLLDEPLSALDRKLREAMQIELKNLQNKVGITFVFVTHDQEEALAMSDRIAVLNQGRILQIDTPTEIYDRPGNAFVAGFVGSSNLFAGRINELSGCQARVATSSGVDLYAPASGFATGDAVTVMLRPEQLSIRSGEPAAGMQSIEATMTQKIFVGSELFVHGVLADGARLVVNHRHAPGESAEALEPGQRIVATYSPMACHLMRAEG